MRNREKVGVLVAILVVFIGIWFSFALAESTYPDRYIDVVIPLSPGGGGDISFIPFKDRVSKILGQPLVVSYKPGSAGAIGSAFVAKSKPDGYTLLFGNRGGLISVPLTKNVGYTLDDFTPICLLTRSPSIFYVKDDSPYKSFLDWVQAAKTKKMKYATYGVLSFSHIGMEYISKFAGFNATHIPFAGAAEANAAVLGGHVDIACVTSALSMVGPGKLRAVAVSSAAGKRWELYPDVPTLAELGYPVKEWDPFAAAYWLWAPKGTSKENVNKVYGAFKKVMEENREEIAKIMRDSELILMFLGPEELLKLSHYERELTKKILDEMGVIGK